MIGPGFTGHCQPGGTREKAAETKSTAGTGQNRTAETRND